jgi:hypothetical protein
MATTEPVESWEQVGEALDRLDIKQAQPSEPNASIQSHANGYVLGIPLQSSFTEK